MFENRSRTRTVIMSSTRGAPTRQTTPHELATEPAQKFAARIKLVRRTARSIAPHRGAVIRNLIRALVPLSIRGGVVLMRGRRSRCVHRHRGGSRTTWLHRAATAPTTTTRLSVIRAQTTSQHGRETKQFESRQHGKTLPEMGRAASHTRTMGVVTGQKRRRVSLGKRSQLARAVHHTHIKRHAHTRHDRQPNDSREWALQTPNTGRSQEAARNTPHTQAIRSPNAQRR